MMHASTLAGLSGRSDFGDKPDDEARAVGALPHSSAALRPDRLPMASVWNLAVATSPRPQIWTAVSF